MAWRRSNAKVEDSTVGAQRVNLKATIKWSRHVNHSLRWTQTQCWRQWNRKIVVIMKNLANEGKSIILITSWMKSSNISDRVTIHKWKSIQDSRDWWSYQPRLARNDGQSFWKHKTEKDSFSTERSHLIDRKLGCKRKPGVPSWLRILSMNFRAEWESWGSQGLTNGESVESQKRIYRTTRR